MSHLEFTLLVAVLLSAALALIGNRSPRERLHAATIFSCAAWPPPWPAAGACA